MPKSVHRRKPFAVLKNGASASIRDILNLIEGSNVTLTVTEDKPNNRTDVTIASSASAAAEGDGDASANYQWWAQAGNPSSLTPVTMPDGVTAITDIGTITSHITSGGRVYNNCETVGSAASAQFGWNSANGFRPEMLGTYTFLMKTGAAITDVRLWIGPTSSINIAGGSSPSGYNFAGFRFIAGTDTNWTCVTNDGGADTGTQSDSGVVVAADTEYKFTVDCTTSGQIVFKINDTVVGSTHSTNLPVATTVMSVISRGTLIAGGATRSIRNARIHYLGA